MSRIRQKDVEVSDIKLNVHFKNVLKPETLAYIFSAVAIQGVHITQIKHSVDSGLTVTLWYPMTFRIPMPTIQMVNDAGGHFSGGPVAQYLNYLRKHLQSSPK